MPASSQDPRIVGRYAIFGQIGSGGMGAVHYGRSVDDPQAPVVAIKLLHPHLAKDPEAATMFRDEAAMARRVVHPNVVRLLEVVETDSETLHVLEYLHGEPLGRLMSKPGVHPSIPAEVAVAISVGSFGGAPRSARGTRRRR
jgi:serine/threonine protein kinase